MKKKFNLKLTAMLVSLFIGLLLVILVNKNKYCLSFGFIILGLTLGYYTMNKVRNLNEEIRLVDQEIDETDIEEFHLINELTNYKRKLKKQKNFGCTMFFVCAVLLVILGFVGLF